MAGNRSPLTVSAFQTAARRAIPTYRYRSNRNGAGGGRLITVDFDLLGLLPGERILDVGCGTGRHLVELCRRDSYAVGIEPERDDLTVAKGYLYCLWHEGGLRGRVNLLRGVGQHLPFRDASFDRILCTEVLEHVPDERGLLREFARLARPGGTIAVSVPGYLVETLLWGLGSLNAAPVKEHLRIYRGRDLADLLSECGFEVYAHRGCHSLESLRWLLVWSSIRDRERARRLSRRWDGLVQSDAAASLRLLRAVEGIGNMMMPKSLVLYARKAGREGRAR